MQLPSWLRHLINCCDFTCDCLTPKKTCLIFLTCLTLTSHQITRQSPTLIDLAFSNRSEITKKYGVDDIGMSDFIFTEKYLFHENKCLHKGGLMFQHVLFLNVKE